MASIFLYIQFAIKPALYFLHWPVQTNLCQKITHRMHNILHHLPFDNLIMQIIWMKNIISFPIKSMWAQDFPGAWSIDLFNSQLTLWAGGRVQWTLIAIQFDKCSAICTIAVHFVRLQYCLYNCSTICTNNDIGWNGVLCSIYILLLESPLTLKGKFQSTKIDQK